MSKDVEALIDGAGADYVAEVDARMELHLLAMRWLERKVRRLVGR